MTAKRNIRQELLASIEDIKMGKGRKKQIQIVEYVTALRGSLALTQLEMAAMLGVSIRTLQEWEQGRRKPSGSAQSLLHIMQKHPEIFLNS